MLIPVPSPHLVDTPQCGTNQGDCSSIRMDQPTLMSKPEAYLQDLQMMARCLEVARLGAKKGELPFGALIVSRGQVIAETTNRVSSDNDVTRHAELVALSDAQKILKRSRLQDCTLYSIVEPCPMCSFSSRETRIGRVVFALSSPVMGGYSKWDVLKDEDLSKRLPEVFGPPPEIVSGLLAAQAEQVWSQWHPLAWHFMKRRGCFGSAADLPERHPAAPRPMFSRAALTGFLAAPALSVSKAFLRLRASPKDMPKFDPKSDS
jgi:tRNA(adenine34) deaminase